MRRGASARVFVIGIALGCAARPGWAASFDCNTQWLLNRTETAICDDPALSRQDERAARRFDTLALKTNYGQYLGLRHWQHSWARRRDDCGPDRACIKAHYRAQTRFLDRVQECLNTRLTRRACLRNTLTGEREVGRR
jgi:uncharacterized protein